MDGTVEVYLGAAELHVKHGTTSMVPTTLTSTNEELKNTFSIYRKAKQENKKGAHFWEFTLKDLILQCLREVRRIQGI